MTKLIQSPQEKERASRNAQLLHDFKELTTMFPDASEFRKLRTLAEKYGMTTEGVKKIIKANGLYQPRTQETA